MRHMFLVILQVFNASVELSMATKFTDVRVFQAALEKSSVELNDLAGVEVPWSRPTPGTNTDVQKNVEVSVFYSCYKINWFLCYLHYVPENVFYL